MAHQLASTVTPISFSVPLNFSPVSGISAGTPVGAVSPIAARELIYDVQPTGKSQGRLAEKYKFVPRIKPGDYRCRAVIDWLELEVRLHRPTQNKHVNNALLRAVGRSFYVTGRASDGSFPENMIITSDTFRIRVQDPEPPLVREILDVLSRAYTRYDEVGISGVEVALDWRPADHSELKRLQMVAALFRHHLPLKLPLSKPDDDLRQVYTKPGQSEANDVRFVIPGSPGKPRLFSDTDSGRPEVQTRFNRASREFRHFLDSTVYRGREGGPVMFRIQNKVADRRNPDSGTLEDLRDDEKRARIEATLLGDGLTQFGLTSLEALRGFRFEGIGNKLFPFWLPTERPLRRLSRLSPTKWGFFVEGGIYEHHYRMEAFGRKLDADRKLEPSLRLPRTPERRQGQGVSRDYLAWRSVNRTVYDALADLSRRWGSL